MRLGRMGSGNLGSQFSGQSVDKGLPPLPLPSPGLQGEGYGEAQRGGSRRMNLDASTASDPGKGLFPPPLPFCLGEYLWQGYKVQSVSITLIGVRGDSSL